MYQCLHFSVAKVAGSRVGKHRTWEVRAAKPSCTRHLGPAPINFIHKK